MGPGTDLGFLNNSKVTLIFRESNPNHSAGSLVAVSITAKNSNLGRIKGI
jgi:hypothetical protein